jgi:hypothetical protein
MMCGEAAEWALKGTCVLRHFGQKHDSELKMRVEGFGSRPLWRPTCTWGRTVSYSQTLVENRLLVFGFSPSRNLARE